MDGENKPQKLYRCGSNCTLSELIADNGIEDLWNRTNTDSSEFIHYDSSSSTRSRTDRIYTDLKIAIDTKIIIPFLLTGSLRKLKLDKINDTLIILCYVSPSYLQQQKILLFFIRKRSDWWEYTNFCFEENAKVFSKKHLSRKH